jgi:hypothetical protein
MSTPTRAPGTARRILDGIGSTVVVLAALILMIGLAVAVTSAVSVHHVTQTGPSQVLLDVSGTGDQTTPAFTVPESRGALDVWYAYGMNVPGDLAGMGLKFDIADKQVGPLAPNAPAESIFLVSPGYSGDGQTAKGGLDTWRSGPHRLVVTSETYDANSDTHPAGHWHVKAIWRPAS